MKDKLRESLSALMDSEGDELELRRVLRTVGGSPDAAEVWRRYHLARSLMQRDRDIDVSTDLSAGIMARIEAEPLPQAPATEAQRRQGSFSFAGSAAVAAAVSLMVITGVQFYNGVGPGGSSEVASGSSTGGTSGIGAGAQPVASPATDLPAASRPAVNLPLFQTSPSASDGLMAVGVGNDMPMFMAPNQRQSQRADLEQARLLQSYLDRHADGAAYRSGEAWMPLLRASAQESLSTR